MRINGIGIASSPANAETRKIGNVKLPDYDGFHFDTQKSPAMSDGAFRDAIREQAKKDQAAGKFQTDSAQYKTLMKSYVSAASPDRKGFIETGLREIFKHNTPKQINYLDLLMYGKITYEKSGNDLSYAEFTDKNGELIASYSNQGWTFYGTEAENARSAEFLSIYNSAWKDAAKSSAPQNSAVDGTIDISI